MDIIHRFMYWPTYALYAYILIHETYKDAASIYMYILNNQLLGKATSYELLLRIHNGLLRRIHNGSVAMGIASGIMAVKLTPKQDRFNWYMLRYGEVLSSGNIEMKQSLGNKTDVSVSRCSPLSGSFHKRLWRDCLHRPCPTQIMPEEIRLREAIWSPRFSAFHRNWKLALAVTSYALIA